MSAASRMLALAGDCESNAQNGIALELDVHGLTGIAADLRELATAHTRGEQAGLERAAKAVEAVADHYRRRGADKEIGYKARANYRQIFAGAAIGAATIRAIKPQAPGGEGA